VDGSNNRRANLRPANQSQQGGNTKECRTNTSGFKGVWDKNARKWEAFCWKNYHKYHLGLFDDKLAAAAAYERFAAEAFGEFARAA
jgi:hypothetical protein